EFTRINNSMRKFKPIRKEKEEVIIKTALQVCHDKWRGVSRANDSGSVFAVLSCFFFLSTQKEEKFNIQLEKVELLMSNG
ncbi:MAG: hypothetical protein IJM04_07240, partial [Prevotella sp.]|nr:hypothetical protein [Prevotella sp.]